MTVPAAAKERAIYHLILGDVHRLHATMLNLESIESAESRQALQEHFTREQNLILGRLTEWKQRRPDIYREAHEDFQRQLRERYGEQ